MPTFGGFALGQGTTDSALGLAELAGAAGRCQGFLRHRSRRPEVLHIAPALQIHLRPVVLLGQAQALGIRPALCLSHLDQRLGGLDHHVGVLRSSGDGVQQRLLVIALALRQLFVLLIEVVQLHQVAAGPLDHAQRQAGFSQLGDVRQGAQAWNQLANATAETAEGLAGRTGRAGGLG
ncbi:hypothetical protein D9M68_542580 [compost metagenome]